MNIEDCKVEAFATRSGRVFLRTVNDNGRDGVMVWVNPKSLQTAMTEEAGSVWVIDGASLSLSRSGMRDKDGNWTNETNVNIDTSDSTTVRQVLSTKVEYGETLSLDDVMEEDRKTKN